MYIGRDASSKKLQTSSIPQIIFVGKILLCGEISDFFKEFEQQPGYMHMAFYRNLCRFVLNLCGENLCGEKMTNRRSGFPPVTVSSTFYVFSNYGGHNHLCHLFAVYGVWTDFSIFHLITKQSSNCNFFDFFFSKASIYRAGAARCKHLIIRWS